MYRYYTTGGGVNLRTDYLDIDNMRVDTAMESFSLIDPEYDTDDAFYYACESLLDAIETDLEVIALEADSSKDVSKSSQSYIVHKLKMGAAKVLASLAGICNKCYKKLLSNNKGNTRRASFWKGLYDNIMKLWRKLKGLTDPNSIKQAQKETESFKDKVRNGMNHTKTGITVSIEHCYIGHLHQKDFIKKLNF